jgi:hypothetical protein
MGFFDWFNFGAGDTATLVPKDSDPATVAAADAEPTPGEASGKQQALVGGDSAATGTCDPYGFGTPWSGYRGAAKWAAILRNPSLAFVRSVVVNQILAGTWSVEADEGVPAERIDEARRVFLPHRGELIDHGMTALDYRCAPFEVVWEAKGGSLDVARFKPLTRSLCTLLTDDKGKFIGIEQSGDVQLLGAKAWLYANEPTPEEPFGRSRLRHCEDEVWRWAKTQDRIDRLTNKETGSAVHVSYPPDDGTTRSRDGTSNEDKAKNHAANVAAGKAWLVSQNALAVLTPQQRQAASAADIVKLLEMKVWQVENTQLGGNGQAIAALDARLKSLESQIARGYLQPERSVFEGQHGTKAEAGTHSDTGSTDPESVHEKFVDALNRGPVNDWLRYNYGDDAVGTVRIVADPMRDVQETVDTDIINALFGGAQAGEVYRTYDVDAIMERRGIPKRQTPLPAPVVEPSKPAPGADGKGNLQMSRDVDGWDDVITTLSREAEEAEGL